VCLTLWISCEARLNEVNGRGHLPLAPRLLHPLVGRPRQSTTNDSEKPSTTSHRRLREDTAATLIRTTHGGIVRPFSSRSKDLLARARTAPGTARRWGVRSPGRQSGSRAPQQRWSFNPARDAQPQGAQRGRATPQGMFRVSAGSAQHRASAAKRTSMTLGSTRTPSTPRFDCCMPLLGLTRELCE
jgi:hypothetical protein